MEWNSKFSSIVKDTESNLARAKERLHSMQTSGLGSDTTESLFQKSYNTSPLGHTSTQPPSTNPYYGLYSSPLSTLPNYNPYKTESNTYNPYLTSHQTSSLLLSGGDLLGENAGTTYSSSGMLTLLHDKIDGQNKTIESLVHTVKSLEEERNTYARQVRELREDIAQLNSRIAEKGIDLQSERKIDQWKQEITAHVSSLQSQLQMSQRSSEKDKNYHHKSHTTNVMRDLNDLKRYISTECDGLRYNVESVKSRLNRLEGDLNTSFVENRSISQRANLTDMNLQRFLNSQQNNSASLPHNDLEISQIKNSIDTIRDRLTGMETDIRRTNSQGSPGYVKPNIKSKTLNYTAYNTALSPDSSDNDLDDSLVLGLASDTEVSLFAKKKQYLPGSDQSRHNYSIGLNKQLIVNKLNDSHEDLDIDDDIKTADLEDVMTANTLNLSLTDNDDNDDLEPDDENDHELSIDELN